jgi:hypothetical protein
LLQRIPTVFLNGLPPSLRHSGWHVLQPGTPAPIATRKWRPIAIRVEMPVISSAARKGLTAAPFAPRSRRVYVWPMGLSFFTVVFDADDPQRVGRFWAAALERGELIEGELEEWTSLPGDPRLWFQKVPEGKTTKNRVHLDWYAPDREAEVERLIGLGATRLWDVKNEDFEWTTLADVEGNEFCVVQSDRA